MMRFFMIMYIPNLWYFLYLFEAKFTMNFDYYFCFSKMMRFFPSSEMNYLFHFQSELNALFSDV